MADIDINTGLVIKADINQLLSDSLGSLVKFKENRKFNESAYNELLGKYADVVAQLQDISSQVNDLISEAQANKMPNESDIKTISAFAGLIGAKNDDGSLDFQKLMQFSNTFGSKDG